MTDWIEWTGGDRPVAEGTLVDVKYRDGHVEYRLPANELHTGVYDASVAFWKNDGMVGDIVAYRLAQPAHVTRMLAERDELADRMAKLRSFIEGGTYLSLAAEDQVLLHEQHDAMGEYLAVLDKRIDRL